MAVENFDAHELGPIRPPSEAHSLFVRVTRNCPWNRCKFCHIYKGSKFEIRSVEDVKRDIDIAKKHYDTIRDNAVKTGYVDDIRSAARVLASNASSESFYNVAIWIFAGGENVFIQDANSLVLPTANLLEILNYLKGTFPNIKRITSYARSHSAARKTVEELKQLKEAGLSRLHLGLESGYDPVLQFLDKGVTAADHIKGGKNVVASGISLSEYVLPGAAGKTMWRQHAVATGKVLSEINPDFIRLRTLTINNQMPLCYEVEKANFVRLNDEEIVREIRVIIENLDCTSHLVSDHSTNLLEEINGKLPGDKDNLLATIDRFLSLSPQDKKDFILGRRMGIYSRLDDLENSAKRQSTAEYLAQFVNEPREVFDKVIWELMERFI